MLVVCGGKSMKRGEDKGKEKKDMSNALGIFKTEA
jgi:hypothetical protein